MAAKSARIYQVHDKLNETSHLVKAHTKQAAIGFIVGTQFTAELPTQEQLFAAAQAGLKIADATAEPPAPSNDE